jgi:hypothetical protein
MKKERTKYNDGKILLLISFSDPELLVMHLCSPPIARLMITPNSGRYLLSPNSSHPISDLDWWGCESLIYYRLYDFCTALVRGGVSH